MCFTEKQEKMRVDEEKPVEVEGNIEEVINVAVEKACEGLENVDATSLAQEIKGSTYEGISPKDLAESMLMTARTLVEKEPNYSYVTARLLNNLENEVSSFLGFEKSRQSCKQGSIS